MRRILWERSLPSCEPHTCKISTSEQCANGSPGRVLQVGYVGTEDKQLIRFRDINQPSRIPGRFSLCPRCAQWLLLSLPGTVSSGMSECFTLLHQSAGGEGQLHLSRLADHPQSERLAWLDVAVEISCGRTPSTMPATAKASSPTRRDRRSNLNPAAEKGNSSFDLQHQLSWNFGYELPEIKR